jgi:hypothetical protein
MQWSYSPLYGVVANKLYKTVKTYTNIHFIENTFQKYIWLKQINQNIKNCQWNMYLLPLKYYV